jgi:hypothetical protein
VTLTDRMLGDLVDEKIVDGPTPKGRQRGQPPDWVWGSKSYRQALQVCRVKQLGCRRFAEIRVAIWLRGSDIPLTDVCNSLRAEFRRRQRELFRRINITRDPRTPEGRKKGLTGLTRQIGPPSPVLLPTGIELPAGLKIAAFDTIRFGVGRAELAAQIQLFFVNILQTFPIAELNEDFGRLLDEGCEVLAACLLGIVGEPEEIEKTGLEVIDTASDMSFLNARSLLHHAERILRLTRYMPDLATPNVKPVALDLIAPIRTILEVIRIPLWRMGVFVPILNAVQRSGDEGTLFINVARRIENNMANLIKGRIN